MASYPTSVVTTATLITPIATEPTNNPSHTQQHININGEIIAIETALGSGITGTYGTVTAALTTLATTVTIASAALTSAASAVTTATAAQTTASAALTTASNALTMVTAAQTTANNAATAALAAQTTANARATYPGGGVANCVGGTAWGTSYAVGSATGDLVVVASTGYITPGLIGNLIGIPITTNTIGNVYQTTIGGQVSASIFFTTNTGTCSAAVVWGSNGTPATTGQNYVGQTNNSNLCAANFTIAVPKNYYYQVTQSTNASTSFMQFTPIGT